MAPAGDARPARLRDADADRGDDEHFTTRDRLRPLAEVEPVAHRRERGGAERRQPQRHAPDQRLVLRPGRDVLPRQPCDDGRRPGPASPRAGTTGPVLHADVLAARRPERLDRRDVQASHVRPHRPAVDPPTRCYLDPDEEPDRPQRGAARAARDDLVDAALRHGEQERAPERPARDLPARRRGRGAAGVLPGAVRRREQLDARVPDRVCDPGRADQRSDPEANRLVDWLLVNGIEVRQLRSPP